MAGKKAKKDEPSGVTERTGIVSAKKFAQGSKSEYEAICLVTDKDTFVLRRVGGNPFHDELLKELKGKKITAFGRINKPYFMMTNFEEKSN
jgi:hypothetical protein